MRPSRTLPARARTSAAKLQRGERIRDASDHHRGMSEWKSQLGDPRPTGCTLSLVNALSPSAYWGVGSRTRNPCRLSLDPDDYIWESLEANVARSRAQDVLMAQARVLDVDPSSGELIHRDQPPW